MTGGINAADDFANLTLDVYVEKKTRDNYFKDNVLLDYLERRVGTTRSFGGDNIVEVLNFGRNTRGGSYRGFDVFNHQPQETLKSASYRFAKYQWPIVAGADEILRNKGEAAIADLWMTKADIALKSMRERLNTDAYSDGTGNDAKNLTGLAAAVDSTTTYGNINRSTYSAWAAKEQAVGGALSIVGTNGMINMLHNTSLGSMTESQVSALLTTQAIIEEYEALLLPDVRYMGVGGTGDGSFANIAFKGKPFMWDTSAPSGILYYLAPETFKLYVHPDRDFMRTPLRSVEAGTADQDAQTSDILLWMQLLNIEPRRNGKQTGIV